MDKISVHRLNVVIVEVTKKGEIKYESTKSTKLDRNVL